MTDEPNDEALAARADQFINMVEAIAKEVLHDSRINEAREWCLTNLDGYSEDEYNTHVLTSLACALIHHASLIPGRSPQEEAEFFIIKSLLTDRAKIVNLPSTEGMRV